MQSSFEKISKHSPCFPSQLGQPPSAMFFCFVFFVLFFVFFLLFCVCVCVCVCVCFVVVVFLQQPQQSIRIQNLNEIAAMTMHLFVKFNFSSPSVSLRNAP